MKIAIIHDWLTGMRGGEKCLEVFCELFPDARIFTLLHNKGSVSQTIENMDIRTSFIQKLPNASSGYRNYLPLFPKAIESFDLSEYDFVLSSSHCVAKGARIPKGAKHICYCYTPMRYIWLFFNEYFGNENIIKKGLISMTTKYLKQWDLKTNKSVDYFLAISDNVSNRISAIYSKESDVIYPPVDIDKFSTSHKDDGFYLIVSALVPYKRVDLAIGAFNKTGKRLVIVGTGNAEKELKSIAAQNIEFVGGASDDKVRELYSNCSAVIFPGEEDFGIVPVEAQASGKAVIAYAKGGALETVIPLNSRNQKPTGVFFNKQTPETLISAIESFERNKDKFIPDGIRQNSLKFARCIFKQNIKEYIERKLK